MSLRLASWASALLLFSFTLAGAAELNQLTEAERQSGWRLLFDGQTTKGWRNYQKQAISDGWQVKDGVLSRVAAGAGDIITTEQFDEFELSLEYRISKGGNSGLMFHVTEQEPTPWQSGPEIQIQDNVDGHDPQKAGWLYQLYSSPTDATRPAGQWNELRILISSEGSEIQMNGIRYAQFRKGSPDWDRRVAKSKFSRYANFGLADTGHICLQDHGNPVSFRNIKIRPLGQQPRPSKADALNVRAEPAFAQLKWAGWEPISDNGLATPLRPIVVTHARDDSDRMFVATQQGVIHVFPNRQDAEQTKVFLDMQSKVVYQDRQNEEGLLGLAFHPKFRDNGEFFVYYTTTETPQMSVISRFRVSADDPDRADPESEREVMRIKQPFWNHNGGTIAFGPDGYLYVGLGDGGAANDPHGNGQNLGTLLGSILRIDVDGQQDGLGYAIPSDNPFVQKEGARGEIWAYGLRNVWRLDFDNKTGELWAGDVGQNLWEEIDIIRRGGNYGWNLREGRHSFGPQGVGPNEKLIEPIFEYSHDIGKSITGGAVYRGRRVPPLEGMYVYADYVSGKIWALDYDRQAGQVRANHYVPSDTLPVITFGEGPDDELYFAIVTPTGRGLYRFAGE